MWSPFLWAALGYSIGSISFARILLRFHRSERRIEDLRIQIPGSEETVAVEVYGANAASMILGVKYGILIGILDMAKVAIPMAALRFIIFPNEYYYLALSLGELTGHNWPIFHRFKGGRGFSVIFGSFIVVDWIGAVITPFLGILLGMVVVGNPMLGYSGWLWLMVPWLLVRDANFAVILYALVVNAVFIVATIPEIRNVLRHKRQGTFVAYREELLKSSPRWRGMKRMQCAVDNLGRAKYPVKFFALIVIVIAFVLVRSIPH
jgi:glycerol-3-phosphate acyltransferase PlsY